MQCPFCVRHNGCWIKDKSVSTTIDIEKEIDSLTTTLDGWYRAQWSHRHMATDLVKFGIHGLANCELYHYKECERCTKVEIESLFDDEFILEYINKWKEVYEHTKL